MTIETALNGQLSVAGTSLFGSASENFPLDRLVSH